jgi:hypothetical protein
MFGIFGFEIAARHFQVVVGLQSKPEFRGVAQVQTQPKRRISRDAPPIIHDLRDRPYSVRNSSFSMSPGVSGANSFSAVAASFEIWTS